MLEQLVRGGLVQPDRGADTELAPDAGEHEPAVDVGELADLLRLGRVDQRDAVLVLGERLPRDQVVVVVQARGEVDLLGDVVFDRHGVDVLRQRQRPQVRSGGGRAVEQARVLVGVANDRRGDVPGQTSLGRGQRPVAEPLLRGADFDLEAGDRVLEPTGGRAVVDPVGSGLPVRGLDVQPVPHARRRLGALPGQHDAVSAVRGSRVEQVRQVGVLAALADDGANGRAGVGDALPGGLVDPDRGHVLRRPRLGSVVQLVHLTPSFVRLY
ncbi:hypothetical protein AB1285_22930 [Microbacterium sp. NRRL B-14842]|uniref:hypothetical protein n=1 Tax=Microbacterium sp. NRRL B-14842 TaxID=3162881 RepID=UPI003D281B36